MSLDHFYQWIDRSVVDPFLAMTWSDFHRKYRWRDSEWATPWEFVGHFWCDFDPEEHLGLLQRRLANRSLRATMTYCGPYFFYLHELLHHAPDVRKRCPSIWPDHLEESWLLFAAAVHQFFEGDLDASTLWLILMAHGTPREIECLDLSERQIARLWNALKDQAPLKPMFPWLDEDCWTDGYSGLGLADTRRFLKWLSRTWQANAPCPYLPVEAREVLGLQKDREVRIRIGRSLGKLLRSSSKSTKPCLLRYFG